MSSPIPTDKALEHGSEHGSIEKGEVVYGELPFLDREPRFYEPATEEERALDKRINTKFDLTLMPLLALGFLWCGIDKSNIGNAATSTFPLDAHLPPNAIPNAVSLLSATFVTLQPVSVAIGRIVGPRWWIPILMLSFGALGAGHAGIQNNATLIALRLLLGAAEAGFLPTCAYMMSLFYPRYSLGFRLGLYAGCYSIASAFAGLIAYGCLQLQSSVLRPWQILFLLEGCVTIALGLCMFVALPSSPGSAWVLNAREREHAARRMEIDLGRFAPGAHDRRKVTRRDIKDVATDWKKLVLIMFNICATLPVSAFGVFLPLVIQGMGFSGIRANLMAVPPFVAGACGLFVFVWLSDYFRRRLIPTIISMAISIVGLIVVVSTSEPGTRYGFLHVALIGAFSAGPLMIALLANNTPEPGSRALIIGINGYSNIAGVIAGQIYKAQYAPSYRTPLIITLALVAFGMLGFAAMLSIYKFENARRTKLTANWTEEQYKAEYESTERRGDQKKTFIYTL